MQWIGGLAGLHSVVAVCAAATVGFGVPAFAATGLWLPPDFGANDPHRVVAVGDSITEGVIGDGTCANPNCVADRPYPTVLQNLLNGTRPGITVINRGRGGETTGGGLARLGAVLASDHPGFVLIMEGTNDSTFRVPVDTIVGNLQAMVRLAKAGSAIPILGSIVPNFRDDEVSSGIIDAVNARLPAVAAAEGVRFVDTFSMMNNPALFGPPDVLHPNQQGYDVLGAAWLDAVVGAIDDSRLLLGGVFVAGGDLDGGGGAQQVITGAGPGVPPQVGRFNTTNTPYAPDFVPYPGFVGGVRVAACDVNKDGVDDVITGAGFGGGPHVRVFDGATGAELASFFAFIPEFSGGVFVACGDLDGPNSTTIIVGAGRGGGPHVSAFRYAPGQPGNIAPFGVNFFAYAPAFPGGVAVAVADLVGDHRAAIITGAGPGGGAHVRAFRLKPGAPGGVEDLGISFFAYDPSFTGGVFVAGGDLDGDHRAELITGAGPGGGPHVRIFRREPNGELTERAGVFAYDPAFRGGVTVGVVRNQVVTGAGPGGGPHVRTFTGDGVPAGTSLFAYPF